MHDAAPSRTALLIARSTILLSRDPQLRRFVPPEAAEASGWFLEAAGDKTDRWARLCAHRWFRALVSAVECRTTPGILLHYALRKRFLEEVVRQSLGEGFPQVVILGAGFDTLALRLQAGFPRVLFLEVDHPATQRAKRRALESRRLLRANLSLVPLTLGRDDMKQALRSAPAYRPDADTVFIAEGLLMYLQAEQVENLLRRLAQHSGANARFAFTFLEPQRGGRVDFSASSRAVGWWLRLRREQFQWGIPREQVAPWLEAQGFALQEIVTPESLRGRYLAEQKLPPRLNGDLICVADRRTPDVRAIPCACSS